MTPWKQRRRLTILILIVFIVLGTLGAVIYRVSGGNTTPKDVETLQRTIQQFLSK